MGKSKIEKPGSGTDFNSVYEKAVKQIHEKNTAFTVIPEEIKKKFLNFYNLPSNEQLELISDLSTINGLPQEMIDVTKQFPYLRILPNEILKEIGSHLKKKDPKEDTDISAFIATHKRPHALFQPDRLGDLLSLLLSNVPSGKQDEAEKIVNMHPELQMKRDTVTDYFQGHHCIRIRLLGKGLPHVPNAGKTYECRYKSGDAKTLRGNREEWIDV